MSASLACEAHDESPLSIVVSVVICAYTEARWHDLHAAVASVQAQDIQPCEIIVVIDHNSALLDRVRTDIQGVIVVENRGHKGLSGARNTGVAVAHGTVVAFLDDDAVAEPQWIARLAACYTNAGIVGVGGKIEPLWLEARPSWFPAEFNWVVGCTYRGMTTDNAPVRNMIGANMSVRRQVLIAAGGFRESLGWNHGGGTAHARSSGARWLRLPTGNEETEFCIRITRQWPESTWLYTPTAIVRHRVQARRTSWRYFLWRCYVEGLGKALVARLHGTDAGLASERAYTFKTLPQGVMRGLCDALLGGDSTGLGRAAAIAGGFGVTVAGYLAGRGSTWLASIPSLPLCGRERSSQHTADDRPASATGTATTSMCRLSVRR